MANSEGASAPIRVSKKSIQSHYDLCSGLYARLWGEHIHHGYWEENETPERAQVQLIERLAKAAGIQRNSRVLDAGCGLGGSSLWLARNLNCRVTGVTLSPVQAREAKQRIQRAGLTERVDIHVADLESWDFPEGSVDVVWSVECTEHLSDKEAFIQKAARWLKPGGRMAFCAWTQNERVTTNQRREFIDRVRQDFLCPSLGSPTDYAHWMKKSGLTVTALEDWTRQTAKTWEICIERTAKWWVRAAAWALGKDVRRFVKSFPVILEAYRSKAMGYTVIVGEKPR